MERLTERDEFGNADIIGVDSMDLQCNLGFDEFNKVTNALNKLAEYEDIGLTPEQLIEIDKLYAELCKELGEYKKLGTLEELKGIIKAMPAAGKEGLDGKETP